MSKVTIFFQNLLKGSFNYNFSKRISKKRTQQCVAFSVMWRHLQFIPSILKTHFQEKLVVPC